jgi:hypothetical protein
MQRTGQRGTNASVAFPARGRKYILRGSFSAAPGSGVSCVEREIGLEIIWNYLIQGIMSPHVSGAELQIAATRIEVVSDSILSRQFVQ